MECPACHEEVPDGRFCTACGARTAPGEQSVPAARRLDRFAANPDESVVTPGFFSTLFPHLAHDEVNEFRWALLGGVVVLAILTIAGLVAAAIVMSAFLVPLLYVMYLYEARVYRDAPIPVVGFTIGGGILLGILVTAIANQVFGFTRDIVETGFGVSVNLGALVLIGVVVPLLKEVLKPIPALLLRGRPDLGETVDGLVLGVAAGLGFSIAETIILFSQILTSSTVATDPSGWVIPLASIAILSPLMNGSTTGAITAALWRFRRGGRVGPLGAGAIVLALGASVAYTLGTRLLAGYGAPQLLTIGWQLVIVAAMLVYVRIMLHRSLLDEARNLGLAYTTCPNCRLDILAAGFCPSCGMALTAVSGQVRSARRAPDATSGEGA